MIASTSSRRLLAVVVSLIVVTAIAANAATAGSDCKPVNGKITLNALAGPECLSPVGLCATGTFSGRLKGTLTFTATQVVATNDTPTTGVVFATGDTVVETASGTLFFKDAITLRTVGMGEFAEVNTIVGGTGAWTGATGGITGSGTFINGSGSGRYTGSVCTG